MKKTVLIFWTCFFAVICLSFLGEGEDDQSGRSLRDRRIEVERVMEAYNLRFHKEVPQSSIIFQFARGDSIRVQCLDCQTYWGKDGTDKGGLDVSLRSIDAETEMVPSMYDRWLPINSSNGKIGIVFKRDGLGEKNLLVKTLLVSRKTRSPQRDEAGVPVPLMDFNDLYIDRLTKDNTKGQTRFVFKLKKDDKVSVDVKGMNGADPGTLVALQYKEKEDFDKTPISFGPPVAAPPIDGGADRFFYEFSHIEEVKGVNVYHVDVNRIPARTAGFRDILDADTLDSLPPVVDSIVDDPSSKLFLEYLEKIAGGPKFSCKTPEQDIDKSVYGRLNLGTGKANKACIDILLTEECVGGEDCIGCDSLWAFWIGAGKEVINRFNFADSTRKLASGEGLIEAYARSRKYRGMQGAGIFPEVYTSEDVFFAILDREDASRFLNSDLNMNEWTGGFPYTFSPGTFVTSNAYMLKFDPSRPLSLCICNNNSVSTVPIKFRFQQFLTEPEEKDTTAADDGSGDFANP